MVDILDTIKQMLGLSEDDYGFDRELITYINSVFGTLTQLGVGPTGGYSIINNSNLWTEFLDATNPNFESVKTYIYSKVRLMFDPPQTSFLVKALEDQIKESEWRLELNSALDLQAIAEAAEAVENEG